MGCFRSKIPRTPTETRRYEEQDMVFTSTRQNPSPRTVKEDVLLQIPGCKVHLIDETEAVELAAGDFRLVQVTDGDVSLAMIVRVGEDLQWPVTKDEPVVKLDGRDYLFTLPVKDGEPLSYGVTFLGHERDVVVINSLELLDAFLKEHSCFSSSFNGNNSNKKTKNNAGIDWKEFAPKIEDYNNFLAKAIAGGTGQIIKGIFRCSNAYTNQVQKGGEDILARSSGERNGVSPRIQGYNSGNAATRTNGINQNLKRARQLSKATEKLTRKMLDGVVVVSGSVMGSVVKSGPGKAFFSMAPGEVLLASLDALNKILDATEAAEKQALSATSKATTRMVSERFGESAGEATGEVLATAGHCAGTAWNILKIRKAFYPSSAVKSGLARSVAKK